MAVGKAIRTQINSVKNTQKITNAMELVAASKMRKAQDRMSIGRPYSDGIRRITSHVALSHSEYHHPFLQQRENTNRVGFIIVGTDRGLCGGLNANLFKKVVLQMLEWEKKNVGIDLCLIGMRTQHFFKRLGANVMASASHLGDKPKIADLIGIVKVMLDAYKDKQLDRIDLFYNHFVNTMNQEPLKIQLLPFAMAKDETEKGYWDYIYEPDAKSLMEELLTRYIETLVYQAVVENFACEQAARMVAMKNATDNAEEIISDLLLGYNKARQAFITREITEITSGAEAIS